ncbi:hypothetical protein DSM43518_03221 [Mycobacterium marinum]|uniref:hypothetical protein n=1 Tax=Mycobacterium marinum TaxID=1781 RepID=UPI000E3E9C84|nr:hypothetical protein [Mycobacterium marinum]RFZ07797.1 hypothetical protein DSM43518_03221 [Mycobacterium marinum]
MTESPESPTQPSGSTPEDRAAEPALPHQRQQAQPSRLTQVLEWVGIVAGVLFIIAVIFFWGFFMGRASGDSYGWHHGDHAAHMGPGGSMGKCGMKMGPGQMGPGEMGPGQPPPTSPAPTPPHQ